MKKIYLLVFYLSLAIQGTAQQQYEFGFIAKVGNYAFPSKKTTTTYYETGSSTNRMRYWPGQQYSLGLWHAFPIGKHFKLSGEFLYRKSFFKGEENITSRYLDAFGLFIYHTKYHQSIQEASISLPIKLHYSFKKDGKFSIAIGAGVSHPLQANISETQSFWNDNANLPSEPLRTNIQSLDWGNFSSSYSLLAGLHYRMDSQTAIGFEYLHEKAGQTYQYFQGLISSCNCSLCDCYGNSIVFKPNLNSFSFSLRHNILE